ncbi:MAG: S1C family serine protease, partial [Clostridiales bacterium]|nr:S1C family serine protease [Clostridiales bacterium]
MAKFYITRIDGKRGARLLPPPIPAKKAEPEPWQVALTEKHGRDLDVAELAELNDLYAGDNGESAEKEAGHGGARERQSLIRALIALILAGAFLFSAAWGYFGGAWGVDWSFFAQSGWLSKDPMIKELRESVVRVERSGSYGSGFNISPQGLIVTNNHVV